MKGNAMPHHGWKNCAHLLLLMAHVVTALQTPHPYRYYGAYSLRRSSFLALQQTPHYSYYIFSPPRTSPVMLRESTSATTPDGFDSHQMDALVQRGEFEASLMQHQQGLLEESNKKITKSKAKASKKRKSPSAALASRTLKQDGVIRIDGAMSESTAAMLREEILERRTAAYAAIDDGEDWRKYFADVLLKSNRCDLLLPFTDGVVHTALGELLLQGTLANVLLSTLGADATLYELSALISEPGSPRQPVHPDNPYQEHPPLLTCFVALQDITSDMGPTSFIPRTNTAAAHAEFDVVSDRDLMLATRPSVTALLRSGDASLFDSRTLHCGGANQESTRAIFYISFRNPRATMPIGNVGSIMLDIPSITLGELRTRLGGGGGGGAVSDKQYETDVAVEKYGPAAAQGDALAQLNLGISYFLGESGVEKNADEAARWFGLAAEQGLAHAQHNLAFCYFGGVGVSRDLDRAAELFKLASEKGHPGAQEAYQEVMQDTTS